MQYVGFCLNLPFLAVASNDNDDLLAFSVPSHDLSLIRDIKNALREENAITGMLLRSPKERHFFQEVVDAERYILLRYFSAYCNESTLRHLKREILDRYLFPKMKRKRKKTTPKKPKH
jgi:hypothetical protein